jgi:membrane protein implicated in regulation of membrane protease activity
MKNHFLSRFDPYNLRRAIIYFITALSLIIISLVLGIEKNGLSTFMFFSGIAFLFYAVLRPWGNAKYYGIMCIIIILLFILYVSVGIGILTKMQLLDKNSDKAIGEYMAFIGPIGVIVGVFGIFRFRKDD